MVKKYIFIICIFIIMLSLTGCTEQIKPKNVSVDNRLIGIWKGEDASFIVIDNNSGSFDANGINMDFTYKLLNNTTIKVYTTLMDFPIKYNFTGNDSLYLECRYFSKNFKREKNE